MLKLVHKLCHKLLSQTEATYIVRAAGYTLEHATKLLKVSWLFFANKCNSEKNNVL